MKNKNLKNVKIKKREIPEKQKRNKHFTKNIQRKLKGTM